MTKSTLGPDLRRPERGAIRTAGVTAGVGLLLMAALAGFAKVVALDGLVVAGDAERTAAAVVASAGLFRLGIASLLAAVVLDVVVAWGLYRVFSPVSASLSMLAAALRLVYAAVFMAALGPLLGALRLLGGGGLAVFSPEQLHAQALLDITAFDDLWVVGLALCGLHLLVIGLLVYRSGYMPRFLGVLLAVAGVGYVVDSLGRVLSADAVPAVSSFTFVGEFLLALWLVMRSNRLPADPATVYPPHATNPT